MSEYLNAILKHNAQTITTLLWPLDSQQLVISHSCRELRMLRMKTHKELTCISLKDWKGAQEKQIR